jgi:integrase
MRAAILLGINCGYGNGDIGKLKTAALDLRRGWATFPRPKTSVARKCPLWAETIAALKEAMAINPKPARPEFEGLALLQETGFAWSKTDSADSPLSKTFRALLDSLEMYRPGLSFYSLRHCHRTVSDGAGDAGASNVLMGHASGHVSESYIEGRDDDRLVKVSNHVRRWLFRRDGSAPAWQPVKGGRGDE